MKRLRLIKYILILAMVVYALIFIPKWILAQSPPLQKPDVTWVTVIDQHGKRIDGLRYADFIAHIQYIEGLEFEYQQCHGE